MNKQFSTLLYSQYSSKCKSLLNMIEQYQCHPASINLNLVCIDNEKIRKQISKSKTIDINIVPCVLVVFNDGGVEKYEGSKAFRWVEEEITKILPPPPPKSEPIYEIPLLEPVENPQKNNRIPEEIPVNKRPRQPANIAKASMQRPSIEGATSIEELESEDEDEVVIKKPISGIRTDSGNYEIGVDFGEIEEPIREVKRGVKSSTQIVKGGKPDILSAAQAMQKIRDDDMEKSKPIGLPIN